MNVGLDFGTSTTKVCVRETRGHAEDVQIYPVSLDASGDLVHQFNTWDRGTLINTYGVDFYSAAPTKTSVVLVEGKDGSWKPYVE